MSANAKALERLECLMDLEKMTDDDIDCSDIPEITDFSNFRPARELFRQTAQWNYEHRAQIVEALRAKVAAEEEARLEAERQAKEELRLEHARETALNLLRLDKLTASEIAGSVGLPLSEVQDLARKPA